MNESPADRPKTQTRSLIKVLAFISALVVLFFVFVPTILSTHWGKEKLVSFANSSIQGQLEINSISLGWFGTQSIENIVLKDPNGNPVLSINKVDADSSLFSLFWNPSSANYQLKDLNATLISYADGTTSLEKTLSCCLEDKGSAPIGSIVLKKVQAEINGSSLHAIGETQQNNTVGNFKIDVSLKGVTLQQVLNNHGDWSTIIAKYPDADIQANADIKNFPVEFFDQFLVLKNPKLTGTISEIIGPQLNVAVNQTSSNSGLAFSIKVSSSNLQAAGEVNLGGQAILRGKVTRLPVAILDDQLKANGALIQSLGNYADMSFTLQPYEGKIQAAVQLTSDRVKIDDLTVLIDRQIALQKTATVAMQISPQLIEKFFPENNLHLQQEVNAIVSMRGFELPLEFLGRNFEDLLQHSLLRANLVLSPFALNVKGAEPIVFDSFTANLDLVPYTTSKISVASSLSTPTKNGVFSNLLGSKADIVAESNFSLSRGFPKTGEFDVKVNTEVSRMEFVGEIVDGKKIRLKSPAIIDVAITPESLQALAVNTEHYSFTHQTPLRLTISSAMIPFNMRDISQLYLNGTIKINDLTLNQNSTSAIAMAALDDVTARWTIDGSTRLISMDFAGATRLEQQAAGKITGALSIENWFTNGAVNFQHASIRTNAHIQKLPTAMLSAVYGPNDLLLLIGAALDVGIKGQFTFAPNAKGILTVNVHSTHVDGEIALTMDNGLRLQDQKPAELSLKITPQGYTAIRRWMNPEYEPKFTLADAATATFKINSLNVPLNLTLANPFYLHAGINADLLIDHVSGFDKSNQTLTLNKVKGNISAADLANQIAFNMEAQGRTGQGIQTSWTMTGSLANGLTQDGSINRQGLSLMLDGDVNNLPAPMLCYMVCKPNLGLQLESVFGPLINAKIKAQLQRMNGPLYMDIKGNNGELLVDAQLNNGVMTLNNDLKAQVKITPQLGENVLQEFIPITNGIMSADQSMRFTIDRQGFALPLNAIHAKSVSIGSATLEMGNVRFSSKSQLAKVLSLLTPPNADHIQVWLTPAYFSLNNGVVNLARVDLLVNDRYPVAAWGNVDLGNDRVNMTFGLPGPAIARAFNVTGIPKGYMLQVPLRGTLSNAQIDKSKAAGRLSAIVAQTQGGPQGLVIGTFLDIATGGITEPKVPSPTTNPLPWQQIMEESAETAQASSDKHKPANPIEEISKGAGSILKKLLK